MSGREELERSTRPSSIAPTGSISLSAVALSASTRVSITPREAKKGSSGPLHYHFTKEKEVRAARFRTRSDAGRKTSSPSIGLLQDRSGLEQQQQEMFAQSQSVDVDGLRDVPITFQIPPVSVLLSPQELHLRNGYTTQGGRHVVNCNAAFTDTIPEIEDVIVSFLSLESSRASGLGVSWVNRGSRYIFDERLPGYYLPKTAQVHLGWLDSDTRTHVESLPSSESEVSTTDADSIVSPKCDQHDENVIELKAEEQKRKKELFICGGLGKFRSAFMTMSRSPLDLLYYRRNLLKREPVRVKLADMAQFAVDPTNGETYILRQVHSSMPFEEIPDGTFSDMRKSAHFQLPLVHPLSGRKFDMYWLDVDEPFTDPTVFLLRMLQQLGQEPTEEAVASTFLWRNRTEYLPVLKEPHVTPWTSRYPWKILRRHEQLAFDKQTGAVYSLMPYKEKSSRSLFRRKFPAEDPDAEKLHGLGTPMVFALSKNKKVAEEVPTEPLAGEIHRQLYHVSKLSWRESAFRQTLRRTQRFLSATETEIPKYSTEISKLHHSWTEREWDIYCQSLSVAQERNRLIEERIRSEHRIYIRPECYIVIERVTGKLYIAQHIVSTDPTKGILYSDEDLLRATAFAEGRRMSLRKELRFTVEEVDSRPDDEEQLNDDKFSLQAEMDARPECSDVEIKSVCSGATGRSESGARIHQTKVVDTSEDPDAPYLYVVHAS